MLIIVSVGAILGYAAGNEIANRFTGLSLPGPFNAGFRDTLSLLVLAFLPAIVITYVFHSREVIATQKAVLRVRDSGAGLNEIAATSAGYGLAHVRERLATLYGERASFTLAPAGDAEGGTLATIRLPLATARDIEKEPRS